VLTRGVWGAVWYRHWLEHAGAVLVALGSVVFLGVAFVLAVTVVGRDPSVAHAFYAALAAWILPLFLHGTGVRTNDLLPGHPSLLYTLTLPVPRSRLVLTRFAVACVSGALLQGLLLVVDTVATALLGHSVPVGAMATASLLATVLLLAVVAVIGVVNLWDDRLAQWVVLMAIIGLALGGFVRTTGLIGSAVVPWTAVGVTGAVAVASVALTTLIARTREF